MGLMKRLHTEFHSGKGRSLSRLTAAERAGWQALVNGSENAMLTKKMIADRQAELEAPDGALESINLELRYTGTAPTVDGQYLVVDMLTCSRRLVVVLNSASTVNVNGGLHPKDAFVKDTQRWFLVPRFTSEDLTLVKGLPTS